MKRPEKLSDEIIRQNLEDRPLWMLRDGRIDREIAASNFSAAMGMANSVAIIAESIGHHPDILIYGWNKLRITTFTHDADGLTELDFRLADKIDELNF